MEILWRGTEYLQMVGIFLKIKKFILIVDHVSHLLPFRGRGQRSCLAGAPGIEMGRYGPAVIEVLNLLFWVQFLDPRGRGAEMILLLMALEWPQA